MTSLRPYFLTGALLGLLGWGGLAMLMLYTLPTLGPRWFFFFMLLVALSGTALPIAAYLHRRFPTDPPAGSNAVIREALLVGVYGCLLAWLQLGRVLSGALVVFIALGFIGVEALIRMQERSRWDPNTGKSDHE